MHDVSNLEHLGLPSLFVASQEFREAATVQSEALGFAAIGVFVPHPIQGRSDEELLTLPDDAFPEILANLTSSPG